MLTSTCPGAYSGFDCSTGIPDPGELAPDGADHVLELRRPAEPVHLVPDVDRATGGGVEEIELELRPDRDLEPHRLRPGDLRLEGAAGARIGTRWWSIPTARPKQNAHPSSQGTARTGPAGTMCMSGYPLSMLT